MTRTQPFFQLEKNRGGLRLTLGASFGRTLIALGILLCIASPITGGPASSGQWMSIIKAAIAAAKAIIEGASFDNNLLCIGEKEVFVVASVARPFMDAMCRAGAFELDKAAIERLTKAAFTFDGDGKGCVRAHVRKELVGKDVSVLAAAAASRAAGGGLRHGRAAVGCRAHDRPQYQCGRRRRAQL